MVEERVFMDDWQLIRKQGREKYVFKKAILLGLLILIILVLKDFYVHSLDFTFTEVINKSFKNVFISYIIAVIYFLIKWNFNENKYQKLVIKAENKSNLKVQNMKDRM